MASPNNILRVFHQDVDECRPAYRMAWVWLDSQGKIEYVTENSVIVGNTLEQLYSQIDLMAGAMAQEPLSDPHKNKWVRSSTPNSGRPRPIAEVASL
jgi:hypothetical protein